MDAKMMEEIRATLNWFGRLCSKRLTGPQSRMHRATATWRVEDQDTLLRLMRVEVNHLADALGHVSSPDWVVNKAIDVAALAMFIADNAHREAG